MLDKVLDPVRNERGIIPVVVLGVFLGMLIGEFIYMIATC